MLCWLTSRKKACVGFSCRRRLGREERRQGSPAHRPAGERCGVLLPDDLDQLAHVHVIWNQELGLVQNRQLFLSLIPLNDDLQTGSDASADRKQRAGQPRPLLFKRGGLGVDPVAQMWTCDQQSSGLWVRGACGPRTYGDLVGVLFPDLLDLFAAIG